MNYTNPIVGSPVWRTREELMRVLATINGWKRMGLTDAMVSASIKRTFINPHNPSRESYAQSKSADEAPVRSGARPHFLRRG